MVTKFQLILGMTITMCLLVIVIVETGTPGGHGRIWGIDARPMRYTPPYGGCERIFSEAWTTQQPQSLQFEMHQVDLQNLHSRDESANRHWTKDAKAIWKKDIIGGGMGDEAAKVYNNRIRKSGLLGGEVETEVTGFLGVGQICRGQSMNEHTLTVLQRSDPHIRKMCNAKWNKDDKTPGYCAKFEPEIIDNHALDLNQEAQVRCVFLCCHGQDTRGKFSAVAHCPVDVTMTWNNKNAFNREAGNLVPNNQFTESALLWTNVFYVCCFVDVMLLCSLIAMGFIFLNRYM